MVLHTQYVYKTTERVARRVFQTKEVLPTLRGHMGSSAGFLLVIFSVLCVVLCLLVCLCSVFCAQLCLCLLIAYH